MGTEHTILAGRRIVVGVCGGIAAYKAAYLVRLLVEAGADVSVVMTKAARQFIGELTLQALSGRPVFTDLFDLSQESEIGHIQVADGADLVIVAPTTANTLARLAAGLADDALAAVCLATTAPILLAPSMNVNMWQNPLTQAHVERLTTHRNVQLVGPGDGFLACQWIGPGRLAEPADIVRAAEHVLSSHDLAGRRVLITAGPTEEPLDPVRYLGNRSSGKMGVALARAALQRGASVTFVCGPLSVEPPPGAEVVPVRTALEMSAAVQQRWRQHDAVIMAAAVADYRPAECAPHKLKKSADATETRDLGLVRNPDILGNLGALRGDSRRPALVGFAAETESLVERARAKLSAKCIDLVVANDVSQPDAGFEVDTNRVVLVKAGQHNALDLASKLQVAHQVLDELAGLLDDSDDV